MILRSPSNLFNFLKKFFIKNYFKFYLWIFYFLLFLRKGSISILEKRPWRRSFRKVWVIFDYSRKIFSFPSINLFLKFIIKLADLSVGMNRFKAAGILFFEFIWGKLFQQWIRLAKRKIYWPKWLDFRKDIWHHFT